MRYRRGGRGRFSRGRRRAFRGGRRRRSLRLRGIRVGYRM